MSSLQTHLPNCSVIIVTHNSHRFMPSCIEALLNQTHPALQIIIVDSLSNETDYLKVYENEKSMQVIYCQANVGFCKGNNIGVSKVQKEADYVLFLNPDAFLTPSFLEEAIRFLELPENGDVGALTGLMLGFDIAKNKTSGKVDSSGVFRNWYGKWHDRHQGDSLNAHSYTKIENVPAICGALFLCRRSALEMVQLGKNMVFDPTFYMYKEDIDLSVRLRKAGWRLVFNPQLIAHHCRGWQNDRKKMPRKFRLMAARNEVRLHKKMRSPYLAYSLAKYLAVKVLDL